MTTQGIHKPENQREKVTVQQADGLVHQERIVENKTVEKRLITYRITQLIGLAFGVMESLIGFRVLLKLIGANPDNLFAHDVYKLTDNLLRPFANLVVNLTFEHSVFEVNSVIAMLVFGLLGWVLVRLIGLVLMPTRSRSVSILNQERHL